LPKDLHAYYHVTHAGKLAELPQQFYDGDPRGIVHMWEPPLAGSMYYMGVDPTVGVVNWDRMLRTEDDYLVDNGAIEIIRRGKPGTPDRQVCEFVAPIHSEDLADVCNLLGRLYGISEDEGQCLCIIEVYPGPGLPCQNKLIHHYGYTNLFAWQYLDTLVPKATGGMGWYSSPKSNRDLWSKAARAISRKQLIINSEWLVEEMADCIMDPTRFYGRATGSRHDDRVKAIMLAIWAGHQWAIDVETEPTREAGPGERPVDWQASDLTDEEYADAIEQRFQELLENE
jgi:hypothetical protein